MKDLLITSYTNPFNSLKDFNTDEDGNTLLNQTFNSSAPDGGNFKILEFNPSRKIFTLSTKIGKVNTRFTTNDYDRGIKAYNNFNVITK